MHSRGERLAIQIEEDVGRLIGVVQIGRGEIGVHVGVPDLGLGCAAACRQGGAARSGDTFAEIPLGRRLGDRFPPLLEHFEFLG
jgi:hypothetical protein